MYVWVLLCGCVICGIVSMCDVFMCVECGVYGVNGVCCVLWYVVCVSYCVWLSCAAACGVFVVYKPVLACVCACVTCVLLCMVYVACVAM